MSKISRSKSAVLGRRRGNAWTTALFLSCSLLAIAGGTAAETSRKMVEIKVRALNLDDAAKVSYARQIQPILENNCFECHSAEDHKGGLDATTVPSLIKGGKKASPAIVPGKPDESPLVAYIRGEREPQMPKGNPPAQRGGTAPGAALDFGRGQG
jgi:mono/diheme cytochrome c family protein